MAEIVMVLRDKGMPAHLPFHWIADRLHIPRHRLGNALGERNFGGEAEPLLSATHIEVPLWLAVWLAGIPRQGSGVPDGIRDGIGQVSD